ncbi:IpaD/SipD/SspD family type III secretion system needle tip protein [Proteus terrae]|uniref:IpaD/SipD/SspD family type III secretion system needle tip protein n=2 Tax=Proteus terrae TaxID=1574161 RepID=UPI001E5A9729|nr:IpaD/SipD/SspD family type III secretion system needle tip protein [Proteus terrae]MCT8231233.1 IpaD/SipD/SspD family type III secretion system needle tip protein [Proteus terrae]
MPKVLYSRMYNRAEKLNVSSSASDNVSTFKDKIEKFDEIDNLLINIRRDYKDFDLNNWLNCNNLNGKTEREIFISLSEQYNKNLIGNKKCLNLIDELSPLIKNKLSNENYPTDSLSDFFHEVKQSIIVGKNDYLDVLKSIFSNYMDYVRELREELTSITQYTKAGYKDGTILVNYCDFRAKLESFKERYNKKSEDKKSEDKKFFHIEILFESENKGGYSRKIDNQKIYYKNKEQINSAMNIIDKFLKEIKGIKIDKSGKDLSFSFTGSIVFEEFDRFLNIIAEKESKEKKLTEDELQEKRKNYIKDLKDELFYKMSFGNTKKILEQSFEAQADEKMKEWRKENDERVMSNVLQTEFDLFKKSLDALEKKMNTNLDELSKKYSSANSNYDNFVKIVSNTMNTLLEMAKGFLRF